MEAKKNPTYLRGLIQAVRDFKTALEHFLTLLVVNDGIGTLRGLAPAVFAREGTDAEEIRRAHSAVAVERYLIARFPGYAEYAAHTPRFLPRPRRDRKADARGCPVPMDWPARSRPLTRWG